jgi:glycogen synthase
VSTRPSEPAAPVTAAVVLVDEVMEEPSLAAAPSLAADVSRGGHLRARTAPVTATRWPPCYLGPAMEQIANDLHIALQTLDYPPDPGLSAIGLYTRELAVALAERGHTVHVVARGDRDGVVHDGPVTVHRVGPPRPAVPTSMDPLRFFWFAAKRVGGEWRYRRRLARRLAELVHREGVHLVEACDSSAESLLFPRLRPARVPFVVRLHMPTYVAELFDRNVPAVTRRMVQAVERRMLLGATHVSAPTSAAAAFFRRTLGLGGRRIAVYPNPPTLDPASVLPQEGDDGRTVLYVGRLTVGKGAVTLAEAIPEVRARVPAARFEFVGPDGPTASGHDSLQARLLDIVPAEHHEAVVFTGHLDHEAVLERVRSAAVCVFPSAFESFGYACLEAMTLGKAIVASDAGGLRHLLDDGRCGLLFPYPDAGRLAAQLVRLLRAPALRAALGARARDRARRGFGRERVTDDIEGFYRRAVAELAAGR